MTTLLTTDPDRAAAVLRRGATCAFPTETVYGLGALAHDAGAVAAVFAAKGRPADNPLIVHVLEPAGAAALAEVTGGAEALLEAFSPGPLTLVLRARPGLPAAVTAGLDTVAVRLPARQEARAVLRAVGAPLVAPSANRSGRPSPTTWQAVRDDLDGRVGAILQGPPTEIGLESTVVDASGPVPLVLRPGAVSLAELQRVLPRTRPATREHDAARRSPGTRHRHYAPSARVRLATPAQARPGPDAAWIGLSPPLPGYAQATVCRDVPDYARRLFDAFRRADADGLARIDAEPVPEDGLGAALMDRLRRAAQR